MFSLFEKLTFGQSSRMTTAVVGLSLAAVGTSIYLSPTADHKAGAAKGQPSRVIAAGTAGTPSASASASKSTSTHPATSKPKASTSPSHSPSANYAPIVYRGSSGSGGGGSSSSTPQAGATSVVTVTAKARILHCADFQWQQDAQATYLANLSDPGALDGARGPHNGDGIACNELPVDPSRPASTPVDAYTPPVVTAASKSVLVAPTTKYFGVAQDGLPGDTGMLDKIATQTGKVPSSLEWFTGFDTNFNPEQVTTSWSRGALPVITWESTALDPNSGHTAPEYTLTHIVNGDLDNYLYQWASDLRATGLPVVIRFDHEMNGNWYPWSAGMASFNNTPAKYIAAWQHVWNIFNQVGANKYAIWMWAPSRVDDLKVLSSRGVVTGQTKIADDYPGDQYVDWLGASTYMRKATLGSSYDATFGKTIAALKAVSTKPIYIAETSAIQSDSSGDLTSLKAAWTTNAINGFIADPQIVGFAWFNNDKTAVQDDGTQVFNDWRFTSSTPVLDAFKQAIDVPEIASGTMPDGS